MKRTFRCIAASLFLLYTLFLPGRAESANAPVYHNLRSYTVDDGLSSNHVYGIVQDSVGFIWFGTDNGLCRFDGREFRSYTHTDGDRSSISSNNIRRLMLDSRGQIWLALDNGVDIYTPATDRFRHFDAKTADGAFVAGQTTEVIEDRGGKFGLRPSIRDFSAGIPKRNNSRSTAIFPMTTRPSHRTISRPFTKARTGPSGLEPTAKDSAHSPNKREASPVIGKKPTDGTASRTIRSMPSQKIHTARCGSGR